MAELDSISSRSNSSVYDVVDTSISTSTSEESSEAPKNSRWTKVKQNASIAAEKTKQGCGNYWSNVFTVATLKRKLPIIGWLPNYRPSHLKGDLIAGLTVGLTVIPQGMAYAALAGLDLQVSAFDRWIVHFLPNLGFELDPSISTSCYILRWNSGPIFHLLPFNATLKFNKFLYKRSV